MEDKIFSQEQEHLTKIYAQLEEMRDILTEEIQVKHRQAAKDL